MVIPHNNIIDYYYNNYCKYEANRYFKEPRKYDEL